MRKMLLVLLIALLAGLVVAQDSDDLDCESVAPPSDDLSFYVGLGNGYYAQGDFLTAIDVYSCALAVDPNFAPAYVSRGFAYAAQGNQGAALDDYNTAIERDPNSLAAYNNRGILYTAQGRFGLALTDFDLILALDPENAVAYNNRAVVHATEGNYELALADFQRALELDPDYATPHAGLGVVYSALAVESYNAYREIEGRSARLPAGEGDDVLRSLAVEAETGTFNTWLPLQTPVQ